MADSYITNRSFADRHNHEIMTIVRSVLANTSVAGDYIDRKHGVDLQIKPAEITESLNDDQKEFCMRWGDRHWYAISARVRRYESVVPRGFNNDITIRYSKDNTIKCEYQKIIDGNNKAVFYFYGITNPGRQPGFHQWRVFRTDKFFGFIRKTNPATYSRILDNGDGTAFWIYSIDTSDQEDIIMSSLVGSSNPGELIKCTETVYNPSLF